MTSANSRRSFLKQGATAAAAAAGVAVLAPEATAAPAGTKAQFKSIMDHENEHVQFLVTALGGAARPKPTFQNLRSPNLAAFIALSQALENTGVGAYLGAAPAIDNPAFLAAAGSIALIEARHAGYLNGFRSQQAVTNILGAAPPFEVPLTVQQVLDAAGPYIANLNGGPPLTFSATRSAANDIAILNFALALEYLEAEYYNINVPLFFGA